MTPSVLYRHLTTKYNTFGVISPSDTNMTFSVLYQPSDHQYEHLRCYITIWPPIWHLRCCIAIWPPICYTFGVVSPSDHQYVTLGWSVWRYWPPKVTPSVLYRDLTTEYVLYSGGVSPWLIQHQYDTFGVVSPSDHQYDTFGVGINHLATNIYTFGTTPVVISPSDHTRIWHLRVLYHDLTTNMTPSVLYHHLSTNMTPSGVVSRSDHQYDTFGVVSPSDTTPIWHLRCCIAIWQHQYNTFGVISPSDTNMTLSVVSMAILTTEGVILVVSIAIWPPKVWYLRVVRWPYWPPKVSYSVLYHDLTTNSVIFGDQYGDHRRCCILVVRWRYNTEGVILVVRWWYNTEYDTFGVVSPYWPPIWHLRCCITIWPPIWHLRCCIAIWPPEYDTFGVLISPKVSSEVTNMTPSVLYHHLITNITPSVLYRHLTTNMTPSVLYRHLTTNITYFGVVSPSDHQYDTFGVVSAIWPPI